MCDRKRQDLLEEKKGILCQALSDAAAEGEALWEAFEAEQKAGTLPEIPEELDAKCRELILASGRKPRKSQILRDTGIGLKRVAVIAFICLGIVSTLAMSVDAIRIPMMNIFVAEGGRYSTIFFGRKQPEKNEESVVDEVLSVRLPTEYILKAVQKNEDGGYTFIFEDGNGGIIQVAVIPTRAMIDFDTEDAERISTKVYDWPAIYIIKNGHRIIWFNSDLNYVYDVNSNNLSETDFLEYIYRLAK